MSKACNAMTNKHDIDALRFYVESELGNIRSLLREQNQRVANEEANRMDADYGDGVCEEQLRGEVSKRVDRLEEEFAKAVAVLRDLRRMLGELIDTHLERWESADLDAAAQAELSGQADDARYMDLTPLQVAKAICCRDLPAEGGTS